MEVKKEKEEQMKVSRVTSIIISARAPRSVQGQSKTLKVGVCLLISFQHENTITGCDFDDAIFFFLLLSPDQHMPRKFILTTGKLTGNRENLK